MAETNEDKCGIEAIDNGMPTGPDVDLLIERFGIPKPGDRIYYEDVAAATKIIQESPRWWTVMNAWRERLRKEHNIFMDCIPKRAFRVVTEDEKVALLAERHFRKAWRQGRKMVDRIMRADRSQLSDENKRLGDVRMLQGNTIVAAYRTASKQLPKAQALGITSD